MCLNKDIFSPIVIEGNKLQMRLSEYELLIFAFERSVGAINNLIDGSYCFLLTDPEGILLQIKGKQETKSQIEELAIKLGVSFAEKSSGTNAISMAMLLKEPVYMMPEQHYCDFPKVLYCFAFPLGIDGKLVGYLDVSTIEEELKGELVVIARLLRYKMNAEYKKMKDKQLKRQSEDLELTDKQMEILELLAQGLAEEVIAEKMDCTKANIKYHKQKIFERLDITCTTQAIIKVIKLRLILVDEIEV
ncbi:transcriptional activator of acetoin/glycerol metabolism [Halobacteroides halobius DSM 5150]|uniref:Transcriptional activator of acetoin/glycerol metabolism n=1 Tax=Halobacteroides halobius (strain ATCC 35273 / DSM 5150 / MD-1) TaxID=748449 RepID=L0K9A9_HALHC|nr:LuxR C-terminal-related transcriptional regulator [Halobacteroides halobius]AGB41857.1 transcriptional activator of acetoin/glycerol metabolism [Halobacteroides halobius DSM 5150]